MGTGPGLTRQNGGGVRGRALGFGSVLVAMVLAISDFTIADAVIPPLTRDLGLTVADLGLSFTAYFATAAAFMVLFGRLGDVVGRRRVMLVAITLFVAASALSGAAWNLSSFFAGRVLAGLAVAAILPTGLGVMHALYPAPGARRERAFGLWAMAVGAAAVLGPLVGGAAAASTISWRWAFLGSIPLGLIAAAGVRLTVAENERRGLAGLDLGGAIMLALAAGCLAFAVDLGGGQGRDLAGAGVLLAVSVVIVAGFVAVERRRLAEGRSVIAPPDLFLHKSFRLSTVSSAFMAVGDTGFQLVLPLLVGVVIGVGEFGVGAVLACYGAGVFLGGPVAARLSRYFDEVLVARVALAALPVLLLCLLPMLARGAVVVGIAALLAGYGVAWGIAYARLVNLSYREVPEQDSAVAGGVQSAMRLLAGALGAAILTAVFGQVAAARLADAPGLDAGGRDAVSAQVDTTDAIPSHQRLKPVAQPMPVSAAASAAVERAYTDGARVAVVVAAAITAGALLIALRLPRDVDAQRVTGGARRSRTASRNGCSSASR